MSLIEEALRKLQEQQPPTILKTPGASLSTLPAEAPPHASPPPSPGTSSPPPAAHSWSTTASSIPAVAHPGWPLFLLAGLVSFSGLAGALITGIVWSRRALIALPSSQPPQPAMAQDQAESVAATAMRSAAAASVSQLPSSPDHPAAELPAVWRAPAGNPVTAVESEPLPDAQDGRAAASLQMTGVVEGFGEPYAVINGKIVTVGERVEDATLMEIVDGTVRLRRSNGQDIVLRVPR